MKKTSFMSRLTSKLSGIAIVRMCEYEITEGCDSWKYKLWKHVHDFNNWMWNAYLNLRYPIVYHDN